MDSMARIRRFFAREPEVQPVAAEADVRSTFLTRISRLEHFIWVLNRMPSGTPPALDLSAGVHGDDDLALVKRVMHAYRRAAASFAGSEGPWDTFLAALKRPVHEALVSDDVARAAAVLRDPAASAFFGDSTPQRAAPLASQNRMN